MRARRHERWLEDVDAILLEAELAELHDDVLNTLLLMAETFADQEFYLHAEFVLDHFITPMEERRYHRVLVNVREFNRRYNNFQTYTLLFADSLRRLARYKMRLDKSRHSRRPRSSPWQNRRAWQRHIAPNARSCAISPAEQPNSSP